MAMNPRTRADVDVYSVPQITADNYVDRFPMDCEVEILETQGDWYKVKTVRFQRTQKGYIQKAALIFPPNPKPPVFPTIKFDDKGKPVHSVPPGLLLADFQQWLIRRGKPAWVADEVWDELLPDHQLEVTESMVDSIHENNELWNDWLADVAASGRQTEALMDEWAATVEGGREIFAVQSAPIGKEPTQATTNVGWALEGNILRWTGKTRSKFENGKLYTYYEVSFYRMSRAMTGWFSANKAAWYIFPSLDNDPRVPSNSVRVFDLGHPLLRAPLDHEISDAQAAGRRGAQYIDVYDVTKKHMIHYCLCGEFCVTALSGQDIIPVLQAWYNSSYVRARKILTGSHEGTGIGDLKSLLNVIGMDAEVYSSTPPPLQMVKQRLDEGEYAIVGCGINQSGTVLADGKIRHWVVLEDLMQVANSGWVRVYNPFNNKEEVYPYHIFKASMGGWSGLWVRKCQPA